MGQFVRLASTLPALSPLSDYASTLPRPKIPRTPQSPPAPPPTAPLPPLPIPKEGLDYPIQSVPHSAPYYLTMNPGSRSTSQTGLPSREFLYTAHTHDTVPQPSKNTLRTHASTPHLRMPLNTQPSPGLPSRGPSLAAMRIALPPPPSHPPPSPPSTMTINSPPIARSPNSAPLVPISTVGYNEPLKRSKSTKAYPSPPSPPRPTTSPPAVRAYSTNRIEDALPTRHANQPIPIGTERPAGSAPWSSTHSIDSTGTSDESSSPLTMKPLRQPESPPAKPTVSKKPPSTYFPANSSSLHAQMAALPVVRLPKLKRPSLRPKTAPSGAMLRSNRSPSASNLIPVRAANRSEGTLLIPSKPVPLSPMSPPFTGGLVSPNLLSPPLTSSAISFSMPGLVIPPQAPTAVPQLPGKIPNFIATYSTVPSQRITSSKPPTGPKDPTRQSFHTLRLVQASLGTPMSVPLSPSSLSQAQSYKLQGGGYVTGSLYVPCSVWHTPETWIFISNLGDKVKALEMMQESLRAVQDAAVALFGSIARPQAHHPRVVERKGSLNSLQIIPSDGVRSRVAQEWISVLGGMLATLSELELGMGKKLGLGEGVSGGAGSMSRTKRMRNWSTRVARKSFGVASGKSSGALGVEYVEALGAVCAGVRMLDGHACAVARLTPHRQVAEENPTRGEDANLVDALAHEYQSLSPQQVSATRMVLKRIAGAMAAIVVPFVLRDLGVLMESTLDNNGDTDWMGAML
jgi:hypothetical protein